MPSKIVPKKSKAAPQHKVAVKPRSRAGKAPKPRTVIPHTVSKMVTITLVAIAALIVFLCGLTWIILQNTVGPVNPVPKAEIQEVKLQQ